MTYQMHMMNGVVVAFLPGEWGATQGSFRVKRRPMLGDVPAQGASLSKGGYSKGIQMRLHNVAYSTFRTYRV